MVVASLEGLPSEVLEQIFRYIDLETLVNGVSEVSRRLREISLDQSLWKDNVQTIRMGLDLAPVTSDYRMWFLCHTAKTKKVRMIVDAIIYSRCASASSDWSGNVEGLSWHVIKYGTEALTALREIRSRPPTFAHYYWALWLHDVVVRLEGISRLLALYSDSLVAIEDPMNHLRALHMLCHGGLNPDIGELLTSCDWPDLECNRHAIANIASRIYEISRSMPWNDIGLSSLTCNVLFVHVARQKLGWISRVLTGPNCAYSYVKSAMGESIFVDFARGGALRSAGDLRDRLVYSGARSDQIHFGLSLYDILTISYTLHDLTSTCQASLTDLIKQIALRSHVPAGRQCPKLYPNLVRRAIARKECNGELREFCTLLRSHNQNTRGNLHRFPFREGEVCSIDRQGYCVIVEDDGSSCLVLKGSQLLRVQKSSLSADFRGPCIEKYGLVVPDIDVDLDLLGQYFMKYNAETSRFV